jgi:RHS repeat-associated protein
VAVKVAEHALSARVLELPRLSLARRKRSWTIRATRSTSEEDGFAMAVHHETPSDPTPSDIVRARIFEEPLVPVGAEPTAEENAAFASALSSYTTGRGDDFSALTSFLDAHPDSSWNIALLTNLGLEYYRLGHYSKSLQAWTTACSIALPAADPAHKPLADRAIGELASMLARLGRMEQLSALLDSVADRTFCGPATERISGARGGLANMRDFPETSFRCGPLALHRIMLAEHPDDPRTELVDATESTRRGCSLHQVEAISQQLGLDYQMAFRSPGAEIITPAVVHLSLDHFAAIIRCDSGRYLVEDPTFKNESWITGRALEAEASGYFLVPRGPLPDGWRRVGRAEADGVWGRGNVPDPPDPPGPCDPATGRCNPCENKGMATARVHLLNASLTISDEPVGHTSPVGPDVAFTVRYNQRDNQFASTFNYSNLGPKWTFDWLAFILDSPGNPLASVTYYMMGGGNRRFTGFDQATQSFASQPLDQTKLIRTSPHSYEMISDDGTRKIFDRSDGGATTRRCFLTQIIDPAGNSVTLTYDDDLRITAITDAIGRRTTPAYANAADRFKITSVTDPFGRSATFGYNAAGQLSSITDVIGLVSEFGYESSDGDFITTLTTPYGVTRFTKGENGTTRSLEISYPDGERERVEFNQSEGLGIPQSDPPATVPAGMTTRNEFLSFRNTYHWDRQRCAYAYGDYTKASIYHWLHSADLRSPIGILESTKAPLEGRVWYDYRGQTGPQGPIVIGSTNKPSHVGRVLDDGSTQLWSYEYNDFGNVTRTIDPVGRTFSYHYAEDGIDLLEIRQTRAGQNALLSQTTWDARHLPLTSRDAAGQVATRTYNDRGQVVTETDPTGAVTRHHYDADGYRTSMTGPLGPDDTTTFTYDRAGRVRTRTDNSGHTLEFGYDDLDRIVKITHPDATSDTITYTLLDQTSVVDRAGRRTGFEYDSVRQLIRRTDALGRVTRFEWCKCGALRRLMDPLGRTTTWRHDLLGRVTCKEYADGSQVNYRYEETTSRPRHRIDEKLQVTEYTYNADDTLSGIGYTNTAVTTPSVAFAYDRDYVRVTAMTDGVGTTRYAYVPITPIPTLGAGRLAAVAGPLPGSTVKYGYDALGRLASTDINGVRQTVTRDAAGRITAETNALGTFAYTHDGNSLRPKSQTHTTGHTIEHAYADDLRDQLIQKITARNGTTLTSEFAYTYDMPERRIATLSQRIDPATVHRFEYDAMNQLTTDTVSQAGHDATVAEYAYDKAGNRLTATAGGNARHFSYNALNELTTAGDDDDPAAVYTWDAEQRLISVITQSRETRFAYDGLGRRVGIRQLVDGAEVSDRRFLWCDTEICEERSAGVVVKRFFSQGVKIETGATAGAYLYTRDHLGSVHALTDGSGRVRARYAYDAFGRQVKLAGDVDADFGFAGMFWTPEAGLNLTLFRTYAPTLGRWLSRDPLWEAEFEVGANLFVYSNNDPINQRDRFGLCCEIELAHLIYARQKLVIDEDWAERKVALILAGEVAACAAAIGLTFGAGAAACAVAALAAAAAIDAIKNALDIDRLDVMKAQTDYDFCMAKGCRPVC